MAQLDIDMNGVKPAGEYQDLVAGKYLVRIEDTEKKGTKDRVDDAGLPHPDNGKNFFLAIALKVYGGPDDGHIETERLNLWNANSIAVNIAKSQLKSIFLATGVESSDSTALHGKWMIMEIKPNKNNQLGRNYSVAPLSMIPGNVAAPAAVVHTPAPAAAPVSVATADALPSWAARK